MNSDEYLPSEVPENIGHVVRFDGNGAASHLGPMTKEGLCNLMSIWFECGYALFYEEDPEVVCLFPIWYHRNKLPVPQPLVHSMSMHLTMWETLGSESSGEDDYGEDDHPADWSSTDWSPSDN